MINFQLQQALSEFRVVRDILASALLVRAASFNLIGRRYRALDDYCRAARLSDFAPLHRLAMRRVDASIERMRGSDHNPVIDDYLADATSRRDASVFALSGFGRAELFRDLIVLKSATPDEKGVILLKYARTFSAVVALLDLRKLMQRYTFVLEPCWAGYCDPSILMYWTRGNPVLVQCFTDEDFAFVERIGAPLVPLRMGPADWVDSDVFAATADETKSYDLVMVANWARHKRHVTLFRALAGIRERDVRVLLVGFPWGARNADDIRREAAAMNNPRVTVEIVEKVSHERLAALLRRCKAFVFLSRKEGDNKALVEAMFANLPAIVYDKTIGGARSRINAQTGLLTSDAGLADAVREMLDNLSSYRPREWAQSNTGAAVTTATLDAALRQAVTASGDAYARSIVCKVNAPNLAYKNPEVRAEFNADYEFILGCRRPSSRS